MNAVDRPDYPGYVVDASVAIKLFIEDPLSERAYTIFGLLTRDLPFAIYVPDLFFIECANVLWKYVRWGDLSPSIALEDLADLARLGLTVTSTADLMMESLELAIHYMIPAYDACYAALAGRYDVPLITADEKLAQILPGTIGLGDFDLDNKTR
jgi:predicted nucleic acid-binding protein